MRKHSDGTAKGNARRPVKESNSLQPWDDRLGDAVTAEIAVMNEEAIALAADSAVTGPKIFTSANKIFVLSKYHPVGIMVFDSAQFLNVPWETIVKQYRRGLERRSFPTLAEHADDFLAFFNKANKLFPADAQERATEVLASGFFEGMLGEVSRWLNERRAAGEEFSEKEVDDAVEETIAAHHERWKAAEPREHLPKTYERTVKQKYAAQIDAAIKKVFEGATLSTGARRQLKQIIPWLLTRNERFFRAPQHSGIVIAGFGHDDVFPRLRRFHFESVAANRLKLTEENAVEIGHDNRAAIIPFAQAEQVETFMVGVDPGIREFTANWWTSRLSALVDEVGEHLKLSDEARTKLAGDFEQRCMEIVQHDYEGDLQQLQIENNVLPIINIVGMLPKDELAGMAESLVNLTSFKRRVTPEAETVGGPIDVAVISRGDGFIWIKRKHYFSQDLNPQFLANYYGDETHGDSD